MKRAVVIVFLLLILLAGALVIGPGFVDWNKYKPQILAQLHNATGHTYDIAGGLEMAVLPFPHVSIDQLTVTAPGGKVPLVKLEKAAVQLALLPLFSGDIVVSKVQLVNPVFDLSIAANGAQSWMTPELQARTGKDSRGTGADIANAIALNEISIKNGAFHFADQRSGQKAAVSDINMVMHGDSLYGPYALEGAFAYNGTKARAKMNTGRVDKLAESVSAQLELALPDVGSAVTYSGVVAFKEHLELQGETSVDTQDITKLVAVVNKQAVLPPYLQKAFSTRGILTMGRDELAYRNLKVIFDAVEAVGSVTVKNFAKDSKQPLDIIASLDTTKPYALEKLVPAAAAQKTAPSKKAKAGFIPETITLPRDMTGSITVRSPSLTYNGMAFNDVAFSIDRKEKAFGGQINIKGAGNTAIDINTAIGFASQSKSEKDGSVVFSDPSINVEMKAESAEPAKLAEALGSKPLSPGVANLLSQNLTSESQMAVTSRGIDIKAAYVKLGETRFNVSGAYTRGANGGRDLLKVALDNFGLDADAWLQKLSGKASAAVETPAAKPDIKAIAKTIAVPFDVDFSAAVQSLHLKGKDYSNFAAKGRLVKSQLTVDTFTLTGNSGDTIVARGGLKDVTALSGIDLSAEAKIIDLAAALQSFDIDTSHLPAKIGATEFLADIKGEPAKLAFTVNLKAMRGLLQAEGTLSDVLAAPKVSDLTLRLQHPNYVELARLYDPSFSSGIAIKKDLDIFASMSRKDNVYSFSQLQATIGPSIIKGDVIADVSGPKPAITAALEITDLPIDQLMGIQAGNQSAARAQPMRSNQDVRWSRNAIKTDMLHAANVALKATAGSISYGNWMFKNAGVNIDLKDGIMDIKQMDGGLYGGHLAVTGVLKSLAKEREPVSFAGDILAQDVSLEEFVASFSGSRLIKAKGAVSLQTSLSTSGLSPAALIFDLKGKGTATGKNIVFEGFDLARLSRALNEPTTSFTENFTRLLDASMQGGTTAFKTLDGAFTIAEGVINFDKMLLSGDAADVATGGTVNLPLWSLDLVSIVQLKEPEDAPPLRASFKGPIDKPAQTFGQNAMQQYFQKQIEGTVLNPLLDKVDKSGALKQILGTGTSPQKKAPVSAPIKAQPLQQNQQQPAQQPVQQQQPQQTPQQPAAPVAPAAPASEPEVAPAASAPAETPSGQPPSSEAAPAQPAPAAEPAPVAEQPAPAEPQAAPEPAPSQEQSTAPASEPTPEEQMDNLIQNVIEEEQ